MTPQISAETVAYEAAAHPITNSSMIGSQSHRFQETTNEHSHIKDQNPEDEFNFNFYSEGPALQGSEPYRFASWQINTNKPGLEKKSNKLAPKVAQKKNSSEEVKGLKKRSIKKAKELDMPPTPTGHDWHVSEEGWNLVKSWAEKEGLMGQKIKKERYAGYLSREAWQVMKEYEYEKIIAQIGQSGRYGRS